MKSLIKISVVVLFYFGFLTSASAQENVLEFINELPVKLWSNSALQFSTSGNLYTLNDHGKSFVYQIDTTGANIISSVYLKSNVVDWESLAMDEADNFYIADVGNNKNKRKSFKIYKIPNPDSEKSKMVMPEIIRFSLPDQDIPKFYNVEYHEFDFEAMIYKSGFLYIFSKNRSKPFNGNVKIYKIPAKEGNHQAKLIDQKIVSTKGAMYQNWITGADYDAKNNILALLSHDKIFFFYCFEGDDFFSGRQYDYQLNNFSQKEGIAFTPDGNYLYLTDEKTNGILGGNLYKVRIPILTCD